MSILKICTLTCARDYQMAKTCYSSLIRLSERPISLTVYHDGTLAPDQCDELRKDGAIADVLNVRDFEGLVDDHLAKHPLAREFCWRHPNNVKLLVLPILFGFPFRYLDSDILFIRPFANLFTDDHVAILGKEMSDSGYSGKYVQLKRLAPRGMPLRANCGILQVPQRYYSLDFIEWFLSKPELQTALQLLEQTIWPMMVGVDAMQTNLENIYMNARGKVQISSKTFAIHFLGESRQEFEHYKNFVASDKRVISAEHDKAAELGWLDIVWRKVRRDLLKKSD
jgi:hypothetical protein